jgi:hypothetical protein
MPKELNEAITEIAALREEFYKMLEFPERIKDLIKIRKRLLVLPIS